MGEYSFKNKNSKIHDQQPKHGAGEGARWGTGGGPPERGSPRGWGPGHRTGRWQGRPACDAAPAITEREPPARDVARATGPGWEGSHRGGGGGLGNGGGVSPGPRMGRWWGSMRRTCRCPAPGLSCGMRGGGQGEGVSVDGAADGSGELCGFGSVVSGSFDGIRKPTTKKFLGPL